MEGGSTIQLTSGKDWKRSGYVIITALIVIYVTGAVYPALGTYVFTFQSVVAVVVGTGIAAIVIGHLKGNLLLEALIGAALAFGMTALVGTFLGVAATAAMGIIFVGNFLAIAVVKAVLKKPI